MKKIQAEWLIMSSYCTKYGFYDNDVQDELQPLSDIYYTNLHYIHGNLTERVKAFLKRLSFLISVQTDLAISLHFLSKAITKIRDTNDLLNSIYSGNSHLRH